MATNLSSSPIPPSRFYSSTQTPKKPKEESMPQSTPIKTSAGSHAVYTSNHIYNDAGLVRAAVEMQGKYKEISPDALLDLLGNSAGAKMPTPDYSQLETVAALEDERMMYPSFIKAMKPYLKKGWSLVNTSSHTDPSTAGIFGEREIKPDIGLYSSKRKGKPITQASEAELFGEFKVAKEDEPFRVEVPGKNNRNRPLEVDSLSARDTRGQIALYINAIQATQQRTRVFFFYIRANGCRLFCHSRTGTLLTPLFDYTNLPYLHQFFWRLSHASPEDRGHDTSFVLTSAKTRDKVAEAARTMLKILPTDPLYRVSVEDRAFYVSQPFTLTHLYPVGRGTRCFSAYDPVCKRIVLLKDTWRIADYQAEHLIYAELHKQCVRHIPTVVAAGAVVGKFHVAIMGEQRYEHYRIVLDVVGKPLHAASSSHQFSTALYCAFLAHWDAWKNAGILHRDISIGNIIIVQGQGMLIDWERAKFNNDPEIRAPERTGTWQFLSVRVLDNPGTAHEVSDDIESFVHVAIWTSARYIQNTMTPGQRSAFLANFDFQTADPGAAKKRILGLGSDTLRRIGLTSPAFAATMAQLLKMMAYRHSESRVEDLHLNHTEEEVSEITSRMCTHGWMAKVLEDALGDESWAAAKDPLVDCQLAVPVYSNIKRRKSYVDECRAAMKKQRINEDDPEDSE